MGLESFDSAPEQMSLVDELSQLRLTVIESSESDEELWEASGGVSSFEQSPGRSRKEKVDTRNIENPRDLVGIFFEGALVRKADVTQEQDPEEYDDSFLESLIKFARLQVVQDESGGVSYVDEESTQSFGVYLSDQEQPFSTSILLELSQDDDFDARLRMSK